MSTINGIKTLNVKELLGEEVDYVIPIYQRNYAWAQKEIEQLVQDIVDYSIHSPDKPYYIGTLVVAEREDGSLHTIDGQQRLTTLTILSAVLKNGNFSVNLPWYRKLNLSFESRKKSTFSLKAVFSGDFGDGEYEGNIKHAYKICQEQIKKTTDDSETTVEKFADYLYQYVTILRVPLPDHTDLNHYFEVMNSRGEQLEKHEILKASLMGHFNKEDEREKYSACFNLIWEACSNMERYVQYGFTVDQRHLIFSQNDWNRLDVDSFDQFVYHISPTLTKDASYEAFSVDEILVQVPVSIKEEEKEEAPERFNTVIDFPNFLLHVLRVQIGKDEVALDDKNIIGLFEKQLPKGDKQKVQFVKEFIFNLLKCKFLFDKYIIKREFRGKDEGWSLKSLKWYKYGSVKNNAKYVNTFGGGENSLEDNDNRRILTLLSMFHVSIPSMSYKYWINAALNYLFNQYLVEAKNYISYLEHIAKAFVFDRFLARDKKEYFSIIHEGLSKRHRENADLNLNKLRYKDIENNLVFNFCDYLLWMKYKKIDKNPKVAAFEYAFRSSVEHYYPQIPFNSNIPVLDDQYLHSFGNLCLVTHEKNSRLYDYAPIAKKQHYPPNSPIDSMKQYLMMKKDTWEEKEIVEHEQEMIKLLYENLNSSYEMDSEISLARKWFNEYQAWDKKLLARALLCFGDYTKHVSGTRYELFNYDHILEHECFSKFQAFVEEKKPRTLQEVIDIQRSNVELQDDYRYLFIKYPAVIDYCKGGYFQWEEDADSYVVVNLLQAEKNSYKIAKELYTYLLQQYLQKKEIPGICSDNRFLYIPICHTKEGYTMTEEGENVLWLEIWNEAGKAIHCRINTLEVNGNSLAVKFLDDYGWEKKELKIYQRRDPKLVSLGNNWEENLNSLFAATNRLFKNGLGIRLGRAFE